MDVDTLLATLMSLGFDFDRCQLAIAEGNVTVESAVEWLVHKQNKSQSTTICETRAVTSSERTTSCIDESSHSACDDAAKSNHAVVSRYAASESQQKAQKDFEERQRDIIQREAKKLKLIDREIRQQVLHQIKEDRDISKTKSAGVTPCGKPSVSVPDINSPSCSAQTSSSSHSAKSKCKLKIRLSSGKNITEVCDRDETLFNVITRIQQNYSETDDVDIIQPFPHKRFSSDNFLENLAELGLAPSGCLVLKKRNISDSHTSVQTSQGDNHNLGVGQGIDENVSMDVAENEPENEDIVNEDIGQELADGVGNAVVIEGLNELDVGPIQGQNQHAWGAGVSLGRHVYNPHVIQPVPVVHAESPAEAAVSRSRMVAQPNAAEHEKPVDVFLPSQDVSLLVDICVKNIARRLPGHQHPVGSLAGISHRMCQKILKHLMRKKALTPKTLNCFIPCQLQQLVLDHYLYVTNELFHTLRYFKNLTHLSVQSCTVFTDRALESITGMKKIQFLDFSNCTQLTNKCLNHLKSLENLETLKLDNTKVTDQGLCDLFCGPGLDKLRNLSLNKTAITNSTLEVLRGKTELKVLNIEQTNVSDLQALEDLKNLTRLNVGGTKITDQSLSYLNRHPLLTKLNLHHTEVTDEGLCHLRGLQLTELHLPDRLNITDNGIKYLQDMPITSLNLTDYVNVTDEALKTVGQMTRLLRLSLGKTKVSDQGMNHLVGLRDLKELDLERTAIGDAGLEVLPCFSKLEELNLSGTHITDSCLTTSKLNSLRTLCKLNLSRTNISDRGIANLQLPLLTLLNLDWTLTSEECRGLLNTGCPQLKALRRQNCRTENRLGER